MAKDDDYKKARNVFIMFCMMIVAFIILIINSCARGN
jgi:hypothetical protein